MTSRAQRRAADRAGLTVPHTPTPDLANEQTQGAPATSSVALPSSARRIVMLVGALLGLLAVTVLAVVPVVFTGAPWWWLGAAALAGAAGGAALLAHAARPNGPIAARLAAPVEEGSTGVVSSIVESVQEAAMESALGTLEAPGADLVTLLTKAGWRCARPDARLPFVVAGSASGAVLLACVEADQAEAGAAQVVALRERSPEFAALPVVLVCSGARAPRVDGVITTTRSKVLTGLNAATRSA